MTFFKTVATIIGLLIIILGFYYSLINGNYLVAFAAAILGFIFISIFQ